jgi:antirestriction protein
VKKIYSLFVLASVITGSAMAACPQIEGKYIYTCTVEKNQNAEFAGSLDVAGEMLVNQKGCEEFTFANLKSQITQSFDLLDETTATARTSANITKSNGDVIKFKIVAHNITKNLGVESLTAEVTKATIRTKKYGFELSGKERSRVLGIFGKRHSKFDCRFTTER